MSEKAKKITKAQRFADIRAMITGEGQVKYGTTPTIAAEFIDHEVELLSRKNTTKDGEKKQTETQKQNEKYKALIVDFLSARRDGGDATGMTCTAIGKAIPDFAEFSTSKMSSLCTALYKDGALTRTESKGKVLFALA